MVNHLALTVERFWFTGVFGGDPASVITSDAVNDAIWRGGYRTRGRSCCT